MKVSAVIMSRNDDHGENLKERALICLSHMIKTFDEVVYVDYNSQGTTLIDELKANLPLAGNLKYVKVTPEDHARITSDIENAPSLIEVYGRNIGLRRATGDIIISTNIDIIPPTRETFNTFLDYWSDEKSFITIARRNVDLKRFNTKLYKFDEGLRFSLRQNMFKIPPKNHAFDIDRWSKIRCCGDFQMAHKDVWNKIRGFEESLIFRGWADTHTQMKAEYAGYEVRGLYDLPVYHILHGFDKDVNKVINETKFVQTTQNKDDWGFPEEKFETVMI